MRVLDLFCGAGGATQGYRAAGFTVVGVDLHPQPHYPTTFLQRDVMADTLSLDYVRQFDLIHASPPCQTYSVLAKRNANAHAHPNYIAPLREYLRSIGKPYVIENVVGAPLIAPLLLCGTMFPTLRVIRHRLFETSFPAVAPAHGPHPYVHTFDKRKAHYGTTDEWNDFVQVTGGGNCTLAAAQDAMHIDWMNKTEINQAIPPCYTEYIATQFLRSIRPEKAWTISPTSNYT
jgi:DNA (cytosine-5)-methyltransferase 1